MTRQARKQRRAKGQNHRMRGPSRYDTGMQAAFASQSADPLICCSSLSTVFLNVCPPLRRILHICKHSRALFLLYFLSFKRKASNSSTARWPVSPISHCVVGRCYIC